MRAARKERGLTWDALADQIGVDRILLLHWAAGRRKPRSPQLHDLATALRVSEDDLLDPPPANPTLAELRADLNLSQKDFAKLAQTPRSTYAALEAGRLTNPDDALLEAVAHAIGRDVSEIRAALPAFTPRSSPTVTQRRHAALRPRLSAAQADRPVTPAWLQRRFAQFVDLAGVSAELTLDAADYQTRTGRPPDSGRAGEVFTGPARARWDRALVYLNRTHLSNRAEADRVLAHEIMHLRWPNYGHKEVAFRRAQQLLDDVPPPRR